MSEEQSENLEQEQTEIVESTSTEVENKEVIADEVEEEAKATGHLTAEEYKEKHGTLEGYKTSKEFVLTGELIGLKKTIQKRDKDIEAILQYQQHVFEEHKKQVRAMLEAKLQEARETGDVVAVEKLTVQKIQQDVKDQTEQNNIVTQAQTAALNEFVDRNKTWFNPQNPELQERVKQLDDFYARANPTITYPELASAIEKQMKYEMSQNPKYSHLIVNTPSRPELASRTGTASTTHESTDKIYSALTSNEKAMYEIQKRIAGKLGASFTIKDFKEQMKRDEEI